MAEKVVDQPSVIDAAANTMVFAFQLTEKQIADFPAELAKAIESTQVRSAIKSALLSYAKQRQQQTARIMSDRDGTQLLNSLATGVESAVERSVLDQVKKTHEYLELDKSFQDLRTAVERSPLGVWVDREKNILYVVGVSLLIAGSAALYATKTGGPVITKAISQITGKPRKVLELGKFTLQGNLVRFQPNNRTVELDLIGSEKLERVSMSMQLGVLANGANVTKLHGKLVVKTDDMSLNIAGDPIRKSLNLGLSVKVEGNKAYGPLTIGLAAAFQEKKSSELKLNAGMTTRSGLDIGLGAALKEKKPELQLNAGMTTRSGLEIGLGAALKQKKPELQLNAGMATGAGQFGLTGSARQDELKGMLTWSLSL